MLVPRTGGCAQPAQPTREALPPCTRIALARGEHERVDLLTRVPAAPCERPRTAQFHGVSLRLGGC